MHILGNLKKLILVILVGISGLLLTLAGLNLIELSGSLTLYAGVLLLLITVLIYFFT